MRKTLSLFILLLMSQSINACPDVLKFVKRKLNSQETVNMCQAYSGKTLLIVNTASYCGFTPQLKELNDLYHRYKEQNVVVLGFPSNDFDQEAKLEDETSEICHLKYGVTFPMFEPLSVRGSDVDPLYKKLARLSGTTPKWNFYKYLVNEQGDVVNVFNPFIGPMDGRLLREIDLLVQN